MGLWCFCFCFIIVLVALVLFVLFRCFVLGGLFLLCVFIACLSFLLYLCDLWRAFCLLLFCSLFVYLWVWFRLALLLCLIACGFYLRNGVLIVVYGVLFDLVFTVYLVLVLSLIDCLWFCYLFWCFCLVSVLVGCLNNIAAVLLVLAFVVLFGLFTCCNVLYLVFVAFEFLLISLFLFWCLLCF